MKTKFTKEQRRSNTKCRGIGVILFGSILLLGSFLGCLLFLRTDVSELEKRELTKFPKFTASSFLKGDFFSELSLWFSDTYPMRDQFVSADRGIKSLYGVKLNTRMVGVKKEADEIPDITKTQPVKAQEGELEKADETDLDSPESTDKSDKSEGANSPANTDSPTESEKTDQKETESGENEPANANSPDDTNSSDETNSSEGADVGDNMDSDGTVRKVDPPDTKVMDEEFQNQIQQELYVKGDAAYSVYYFVQDAATTYINAVNRAAQELKGETDVYCMLIPNQSGALLSEKELKGIGGSDQMQAIDYYYSMLEGVKTADTIRTLREHQDEYLYFRTDHHWTQLAAYYVYENFCKVKGITPIPLEERTMYTFENFLGTFYTTLQNSNMEKNPDTVYAYKPNGTNSMVYWDTEGEKHDWRIICDMTGWAQNSLYMTFIAGDRPLSVIKNPEITDGSSCLVLKESYGNCFVPLLVDHYQTVYVMDYRYAQLNVLDYVRRKKIDDLILINNITIIGGKSAVNAIDELLK